MDDSHSPLPAQQKAFNMETEAMTKFKGQTAKQTYGAAFWQSMARGQTPEAALSAFKASTSSMTRLIQDEVRQIGCSETRAEEVVRLAMLQGIREKLDQFAIPVNHKEMASATPSFGQLLSAPHTQKVDLDAARDQTDHVLLLWFKRAKESLERGSPVR